jgi:N-acetylglutamate synthase-like GNAT family acetyltransferase
MIRQFHRQDASACCSLIRECLSKDPTLLLPLREKLQASETPQTMEERARLFYVAVFESKGLIQGVVGLDLNEIRILCVSPQCRGGGIGRALVDHIRTMVPATLFPDVFVYSSLEGREFYKACGFLDKGPVEFIIGSERMPAHFMACPLR